MKKITANQFYLAISNLLKYRKEWLKIAAGGMGPTDNNLATKYQHILDITGSDGIKLEKILIKDEVVETLTTMDDEYVAHQAELVSDGIESRFYFGTMENHNNHASVIYHSIYYCSSVIKLAIDDTTISNEERRNKILFLLSAKFVTCSSKKDSVKQIEGLATLLHGHCYQEDGERYNIPTFITIFDEELTRRTEIPSLFDQTQIGYFKTNPKGEVERIYK